MTASIIPRKALKDTDSAERIQFFRILMIYIRWGLFVLPIFAYKFGWLGVILWCLLCLTLAIMVEFFTDRFGSVVGRIYKGRPADWSLREKLSSAMDVARVQKNNREYKIAIVKVNDVLAQDPTFAEAWYLKAQILHEGSGQKHAVLGCLDNAIRLSHPDEPVRRWAWALKKTINP